MPAGGQVTHSHVLAGASPLANGFRPYRAPHNMSVPSARHIGTDQGDTGLTCGAGGLYRLNKIFVIHSPGYTRGYSYNALSGLVFDTSTPSTHS